MKRPEKREVAEVKWALAPGFKTAWKAWLAKRPEIRDAMKAFNEHKRAKPALKLPKKMADHKLDGPLSGFMDCHLAPDVILIYTPQANGGVKLWTLCDHSDLKGPKAKELKKKLK
jgi:mRNA-degrading endonuclease YafQ of YafQ-DinJ toxin-antitoxin module